jgi:hypothetical protein
MEQYDWLQNECSHSKVYTMTKTSLVENFKHDEKNDMVVNKIALLGEFYGGLVY